MMKYLAVTALWLATFCIASNTENAVGISASCDGFEFVLRELVKQKVEIEKMASVVENLTSDNAKLKAETENLRATTNQQTDELEKLRRIHTSTGLL